MPITIINKGEGFRTKVKQALDVWARVRPEEVAQFAKDCGKLKQQRLDSKCYWVDETGHRDTDNATIAITPRFPEMLLAMSEFSTQMLYASPCGTGERLWRQDEDLNRIFKSELACGILSPMRV